MEYKTRNNILGMNVAYTFQQESANISQRLRRPQKEDLLRGGLDYAIAVKQTLTLPYATYVRDSAH